MRHLTPLSYIDAVARAGSIRKAAETLAITSTALNRRVLGLEEELGVPIFERLPRGVRLTTAGELLIAHIRTQASDFDKLRGQIADLAGERRGHVAIASSQALVPYFLPEQIATYRADHPAVTFAVHVRDRAAAEQALVDFAADLAMVFEPVTMRDIQVITTIRQQVHAVMRVGHPLAGEATVRLRDCARFPVGLPTQLYGVRRLLDLALMNSSIALDVVIETDSFDFLRHYPRREEVVTFQIPIGLPSHAAAQGIVSRPIHEQDVPDGLIYLCQLRGRTLPVAAAKFAMQVERELDARFS